MNQNIRKPDWLKIRLPKGESYLKVKGIVEQHGLHTICLSGKCPNIAECWGCGTATFLILGNICTRSCKFCATATGKPLPIDKNEPLSVAKSVQLMKLKHVVITSVDRDDLPDGGAAHWAETIRVLRKECAGTTVEVLIPDFAGNPEHLNLVINQRPEIISHNLETIERLTPQVRSAAKYDRSLIVLKQIADAGVVAKSGIMVGLGETETEVLQTMDDMLTHGVSILTIGQYLCPTKNHLPVAEYITPQQFEKYRQAALAKGFRQAESKPLVRSSYHAEKHIREEEKRRGEFR